ncbi:MAG: PD40 domain-containing protein, partial [Acidobacteria bacterium]|nr:PD40 domain-containing protein [Acidobacteriota bacterium]
MKRQSPGRTIVTVLTFAALALWILLPQAQEQDQDADKDKTGKETGLILPKESTVAFVTDEGTWMSLDVSPDGRTIAFDLLGDIYTLPTAGGEATRILDGMSFDSQPKFSPDGRLIAFLSDRSGVENLWTAKPDGSDPKPVTKDEKTSDRPQYLTSPSWTRDGRYLIVARSRPPERTFGLFIYDKDGGTGIRIGPAPPPPPSGDGPPPPQQQQPPNKMGAVASPDGRYIYYTERRGSFTYNARFPLWQVMRFDRETGDTSTITNAQGSAMRPALSPDGRFMVYATRFETATGLRVRDLETSEERWLIYPVTRDDQESRAARDTMPGYAFTADGKSLIVPIDGKIKRVDFESGAAETIPFTAKVAVDIAPRVYFENRIDVAPMVKARLVRWPALSPDGKRVAFTALNKIWLMDLPSGRP